MKIKKFTALAAAFVLSVCVTACSNDDYTKDGGEITTADLSQFETVTETVQATDFDDTADDIRIITDREGSDIEVPKSVSTIVSTAPSITEILEGLGLSGKIIAADLYSADVEGISPEICTIDFYNLNIEELTAMAPDLIIVSGMSMTGADDPYAALKEAGVNVVYIPTSDSISGVKLDIEFLADYLGVPEKGAALTAEIDRAVTDISDRVAAVSPKTVYFEIGAAPYLYSCGGDTFIDEMITVCGGVNIYAGETGWLSNSEESVIAAAPDVIITNVQYDGYDYTEILSRPGWENIPAVQSGAVYSVSSNATSRPSQHVTEGLYQIAGALYPEIFPEISNEE